jgi:Rod binding domain-containing protein
MSVTNPPTQLGIAIYGQSKPKPLDQPKKIDDRQYIPEQFKEVAASMEQQFAEMMIDQMSRTVGEESSGEDGMASEYYKSLQKSERAKAMTKQNDLGLQNVILDQIYPKRMRNELALKQYQAQTNQIHQNLPSYKIDRKIDTIEMGKNDSTPVSEETTPARRNEVGGLP